MKAKFNPDFEQRAIMVAKGLPVANIKNPDGSYSTHKMISSEVGGRNIALPTIVNKNGKLVELPIKDAIKYALETGEYKEFNSFDEADEYARGAWKNPNYNAIQAVKRIMGNKYAGK